MPRIYIKSVGFVNDVDVEFENWAEFFMWVKKFKKELQFPLGVHIKTLSQRRGG